MSNSTAFDDDRRFCPSCREYVRYLLGLQRGFCARCDTQVVLFSPEDLERFRRPGTRRPPDPFGRGALDEAG